MADTTPTPMKHPLKSWLNRIVFATFVLGLIQQQGAAFPPAVQIAIGGLLAACAAVLTWKDELRKPAGGDPVAAVFTSLPMWAGALIAGLTTVQQIATAYDVVFPPAVTSAISALLATAAVAQRAWAYWQTTVVPGAPPPRPGEGFAHVQLLALIALLALLATLAGCSAAQWPKGCTQIERGGKVVLQCRCAPFAVDAGPHPTKPWPAGAVGFDCNGQRMPIELLADDVSLPHCQP